MNIVKTIWAAGVALALAITPAGAQESEEAAEFDNGSSYTQNALPVTQGAGTVWNIPVPGAVAERAPNTVNGTVISADAKMVMMQSMMTMNPFSLRQMINMMVAKKKVSEGISFDEVLESMDLRANLLNMKKVGHNTPWKVIEGTTGEATPRIEMISYCDIPTMRAIVDYVPEFAVFVPCRISVLEDAVGDIWIMTLDWDVRWMDTSPHPDRIASELRDAAVMVRENLESIMEAGANGDL